MAVLKKRAANAKLLFIGSCHVYVDVKVTSTYCTTLFPP